MNYIKYNILNLTSKYIKKDEYKKDKQYKYVKKLKIHDNYVDKIIYPKLKHLHIESFKNILNINFNNFPNIKSLKVSSSYHNKYDISLNTLPISLQELTMECNFNDKVDNLPYNLQKLIINSNKKTDDFYFTEHDINKIKQKSTNIYFNQLVDLLPESLIYLEINSPDFDKKLDDLPHLKYLSIYSFVFNNRVNCLPGSLETLKLVCPAFNQELNHLPISLKYLQIYLNYNNKIYNIPNSLLNIIYVKAYKYNDIPYFVKNTIKLNVDNNKLKVYTIYVFENDIYASADLTAYYEFINKPISYILQNNKYETFDINPFYNIFSNKNIEYKVVMCDTSMHSYIYYIYKFYYDFKKKYFIKYKFHIYNDM